MKRAQGASARSDPALEKSAMPRRIMHCSPFVVFGVLFLVRPAYGYIDPGTGSYVLQTLLGLLLTVAYTMKIYWRQIAGFFRYRLGRKRRAGEPEK